MTPATQRAGATTQASAEYAWATNVARAALAYLDGKPLAPTPTLDADRHVYQVGYDDGYLAGLRDAVDEARARRLIAAATGGAPWRRTSW
ncbi:hypothetical protein [Arsenicicoccus dermatophilus]|uniref:hypothetical protein n=1 Tax=Arsenicicoccus dermatophilus TaxID=1076331 RepID=UPI001F4CEFBD|nr:hypothetical protein [Arsenicicoccus dermatophilus]MCH8612321.1 hypothetical protein [Arsenicicoccus dermatophilus]